MEAACSSERSGNFYPSNVSERVNDTKQEKKNGINVAKTTDSQYNKWAVIYVSCCDGPGLCLHAKKEYRLILQP
jgi:hypothetical protein